MNTGSVPVTSGAVRHESLSIDGQATPSLVFPVAFGRAVRLSPGVWIIGLGLALVAAYGTLRLVGAPSDPTLLTLCLVASALVVVLIAVIAQVRAMRQTGFIALTRTGIYAATSYTRSSVDWSAVTAMGPYSFAGKRYLGIRTDRPPRVSPRWLGIFRSLNRRIAGWDLMYPLFVMSDAEQFERLVAQAVNDPSARDHIVNERT